MAQWNQCHTERPADDVYHGRMANHKRGRPKQRRAGCLLCKPHKLSSAKKGGHPYMTPFRTDVLRAVEAPADLIEQPRPGQDWFYLRDAGPSRWLKVVVAFDEDSVGSIAARKGQPRRPQARSGVASTRARRKASTRARRFGLRRVTSIENYLRARRLQLIAAGSATNKACGVRSFAQGPRSASGMAATPSGLR